MILLEGSVLLKDMNIEKKDRVKVLDFQNSFYFISMASDPFFLKKKRFIFL
jgi:predicted ribosome-associated RNA-binding protein Tma20